MTAGVVVHSKHGVWDRLPACRAEAAPTRPIVRWRFRGGTLKHRRRLTGGVQRRVVHRRLSGVRAATLRRLAVEPLEDRRLLAGSWWEAPCGGGEGESSDVQVTLRLVTTDLQGAVVTQVSPGHEFFLEVYVRDVRVGVSRPGVFAAYLDVTYPADLLAVVPSFSNPLGFDIEFGPEYGNGQWGTVNLSGLINEVGAFQSSFRPLGSAEFLLFRTRLKAGGVVVNDDMFTGVAEDSQDVVLDVLGNDLLRGGSALLASNPADISPAHDLMTYDPPVAVPHAEIGFGQTVLTIPSTGTVAITGVTQPGSGGSVRVADDGTHVIYTPPPDYFGIDSFTYTVAGSWTGQVTVVVDPVNDAPVAEHDAYSLGRNQVLVADAARGVLRNDLDVDRDPLSVTLVDPPEHGSLVLHGDGSFVYVPDTDYVGPDRFTYQAHDLWSSSNIADVSLDIGSPQVSVRLEFVDGAGLPVESIAVGDALSVRAWVRDLRDDFYPNRGVYAAFLDLLFDPADLQPRVNSAWPLGFEIDFGPDFWEPGYGDAATGGVIQEVGSVALRPNPLGTDERLLFEMPFDPTGPRTADDAYQVSYQSVHNVLDVLANDDSLTWTTAVDATGAGDLPNRQVRLHQPRVAVPAEEVLWTGDQLTIGNGERVSIIAVGPASDGGMVTVAEDGRHLQYRPAIGFEGQETLTYTVADPLGQIATGTVVVHVTRSWQNLHHPMDVNSDSFVTPIDALMVINYLNAGLPGQLDGAPDGPPFWDVNGDGYVTPIDALHVINFLNRQGAVQPEGEGESGGVGPGQGVAAPFAAGPPGHALWAGASGPVLSLPLATSRTGPAGVLPASDSVWAWMRGSALPVPSAPVLGAPSAVRADLRAAAGSDDRLDPAGWCPLEETLALLFGPPGPRYLG